MSTIESPHLAAAAAAAAAASKAEKIAIPTAYTPGDIFVELLLGQVKSIFWDFNLRLLRSLALI